MQQTHAIAWVLLFMKEAKLVWAYGMKSKNRFARANRGVCYFQERLLWSAASAANPGEDANFNFQKNPFNEYTFVTSSEVESISRAGFLWSLST